MTAAILALAVVTGVGTNRPDHFVPALVSNGRLSCQVGPGLSVDKVFWEGRRTPDEWYWLWDHGGFSTRLSVDGASSGSFGWSESLDPLGAAVTTEDRFGEITLRGEVFIPRARNVIAMRRTVTNRGAKPHSVNIRLDYRAPSHERIVGGWNSASNVFSFTAYMLKVTHETITLSGEGTSRPVAFTLKPGESRSFDWFIDYRDDYSTRGSVLPVALPSYSALLAAHRADWAAYYAESKLGDAARMAEYQLRCVATEWSFPVGISQDLFDGKIFAWDEMFAVEGLLAAGHVSTAKLAVDYRAAMLTQACHRVAHKGSRPLKDHGARYVWEGVEDLDLEGTSLGFWNDHYLHMPAVARTMWLYWEATRDLEYLREKGYPVIDECARFFRKIAVQEMPDGSAFIGKCCDLERIGPGVDHGFLTTVGAIYTLRRAAEAAEVLGVDASDAVAYRKLADRLFDSLPEKEGRYLAAPNYAGESIGTLAPYAMFDPVFGRDNAKANAAVRHFLKNGRAFGNMYPTGTQVCSWYAFWMSAAAFRMGDGEAGRRWRLEGEKSRGAWGEYWEIREPGAALSRPWFMSAAGSALVALRLENDFSKGINQK